MGRGGFGCIHLAGVESQPSADDVGWAGRLGGRRRVRLGQGADDTMVRWVCVAELHPSHQHGTAPWSNRQGRQWGGVRELPLPVSSCAAFELDYRCVRAVMDCLP